MPARHRCPQSMPLRAVVLAAATAVVGAATLHPDGHAAGLLDLPGTRSGFIRVQSGAWPGDLVLPGTPTPVVPTPAVPVRLHVTLRERGSGVEAFDVPFPRRGTAVDVLPGPADRSRGLLSAVVRADRPIAAVSGAIWGAADRFAEAVQATPARDVVVPWGVRPDGETYLAIQNAVADRPARVAVAWSAFGESGAGKPPVERTIPAGQAVVLDLARDPDLAGPLSGVAGTLRVTSDVPVAVHAWVSLNAPRRGLYAFEGIPAEQASDTLFVPLIRHAFAGRTTTIAFVNLDDAPVAVSLSYRMWPLETNAASCRGSTFFHAGRPVEVPAGASMRFSQADAPSPAGASGLPPGCTGSAVLSVMGGKGVATVVDERSHDGAAAATSAVGRESGALRVAVPAFRRRYGQAQVSTGLVLMNVSRSSATVVLAELADGGSLQSIRCKTDFAACPTIAPGDIFAWPPANSMTSQSPLGGIGAVQIASTEPLAVVACDEARSGAGDVACYNGIAVDGDGTDAPLPGMASVERFIPLMVGWGQQAYLPFVRRGSGGG